MIEGDLRRVQSVPLAPDMPTASYQPAPAFGGTESATARSIFATSAFDESAADPRLSSAAATENPQHHRHAAQSTTVPLSIAALLRPEPSTPVLAQDAGAS